MDYQKKYKKRIDEIEEYMEYLATMFDEIQTPENNTIDEIGTPTDNNIDEVATPANNNIDSIKTPSNYDSDLKVSRKKTTTRTERVETIELIPPTRMRKIKEEVEDWLEDYLLYAYIEGTDALGQMLSVDAKVNEDRMASAVNNDKALDVGTWRDSLAKHIDGGNIGLAKNLAESEFHRVYNEAILDSAKANGGKYKTWATMLDDRVRETHDYLEGVSIPLEEEFFTYDGDHGMYPGGFQTAEENCNCRCFIKVS